MAAHRIADLAGIRTGVVLWCMGHFKHTALELFWKGLCIPVVVYRLVLDHTGQGQVTLVPFLCLLDFYDRLWYRV